MTDPLYLFDKQEWRDVMFSVAEITEEQFEASWQDFIELKRRKGLQ